MTAMARPPQLRALPDWYLQAEPALIDGATDECLRLHGPGIISFVLFATGGTEIRGTRIPQDMPGYVSAQAAGFDPLAIEDPFHFAIRRKNPTPLVFGTGIHRCIGHRLARCALRAAVSGMLARSPAFWQVDPAFRPVYRGLTGELSSLSIPMRTHWKRFRSR